MTADPASHKWVRVYNEDIGEPGCKNWHANPKWGVLGMLLGWWRVKISSGCPLAEGLRPPEIRWRRSDSAASGGGATRRDGADRPGQRDAGTRAVPGQRGRSESDRRPGTARVPASADPTDRPPAPWGSFPLTEIVIFIGVVLLVAGFFVPPPQGFVMIAVGLGLGSLAGLELAIREHYRRLPLPQPGCSRRRSGSPSSARSSSGRS